MESNGNDIWRQLCVFACQKLVRIKSSEFNMWRFIRELEYDAYAANSTHN